MPKRKTDAAPPAAQAPQSQDPTPASVTLTGRLVATPVLRRTANGTAVATICIAVNNGAAPEFHDVVVWRRTAEAACTYLTQGRLVEVTGRVNTRTWRDQDGEHARPEIIAWRVQFLPRPTPVAAEAA